MDNIVPSYNVRSHSYSPSLSTINNPTSYAQACGVYSHPTSEINVSHGIYSYPRNCRSVSAPNDCTFREVLAPVLPLRYSRRPTPSQSVYPISAPGSHIYLSGPQRSNYPVVHPTNEINFKNSSNVLRQFSIYKSIKKTSDGSNSTSISSEKRFNSSLNPSAPVFVQKMNGSSSDIIDTKIKKLSDVVGNHRNSMAVLSKKCDIVQDNMITRGTRTDKEMELMTEKLKILTEKINSILEDFKKYDQSLLSCSNNVMSVVASQKKCTDLVTGEMDGVKQCMISFRHVITDLEEKLEKKISEVVETTCFLGHLIKMNQGLIMFFSRLFKPSKKGNKKLKDLLDKLCVAWTDGPDNLCDKFYEAMKMKKV